MAASAPNTPTPQDPRPTGDLEYLFQQTFAEAEVAPRSNLWEQLDLEMVSEQNNTFRRRLVVHRWVAAACLLLALGFGGWAALRQFGSSQSEEIAANYPAPSTAGRGAANGMLSQASRTASGTAVAPDGLLEGGSAGSAYAQAATTPNRTRAGAADRSLSETLADAYQTARAAMGQAAGMEIGTGATTVASAEYWGSRGGTGYRAGSQSGADGAFGASMASTFSLTSNSTGLASTAGLGSEEASSLAALQARLRSAFGLRLPDTLKPSLLAMPAMKSAMLAANEPTVEEKQPTKLWHRLRVGGSYSAGAYNPNINFSQADGRIKADPLTLALNDYYQEDAETEYRRNLRAGLSQRLAVTVDYALNRKLSVRTGAEVAEQRATSATSYGFVDGKQVGLTAANALFSPRPSFASRAPQAARTTTYRYRTAGIPVEVRYASSRPGVSLYAKVGAAVNLLLGSRSELGGAPEATRTYTLTTAESPYRQVLVSGRGGAGMRYQPAAASWSVSVGPTADAGFNTMNARPAQSMRNQSRPYSVGIEASVEFGANRPVAPIH